MPQKRNESERGRFDRRTFLRGAVGTGITLGGLPAVTGVADAGNLNAVDEGTLQLSGLTWENATVTYDLRVNRGVAPAMEQGVNDGIDDWQHFIRDHASTGLTDFVEASGGSADVTIQVKRGGGLVAGQELTLDRDNDGAADSSRVQISGSSFGDFEEVYDRTLSVTLHELGHSFQLGHYSGNDEDKEIMSPEVQDPPVTNLSTCDLSAFNTAHDGLPNPPEEGSVDC